MKQEAVGVNKKWTRQEVEVTLKEILMDALGVDEEKIIPEASLVHDLGAESIDFLDIGFRVQQTFGIELPNKAIQEKAIGWRNLGELRRIFEERYRTRIELEEMKQLHMMGVPEVLRWLAENKGVSINNGEAEDIASALADRFVREVEAVGFKASLVNRDDTVRLLLENLNSPKLMEGMIRLFSVGALVDFISERVEDKAQ